MCWLQLRNIKLFLRFLLKQNTALLAMCVCVCVCACVRIMYHISMELMYIYFPKTLPHILTRKSHRSHSWQDMIVIAFACILSVQWSIHTEHDNYNYNLHSHQFKGPWIDVNADYSYSYRAQCEWPLTQQLFHLFHIPLWRYVFPTKSAKIADPQSHNVSHIFLPIKSR